MLFVIWYSFIVFFGWILANLRIKMHIDWKLIKNIDGLSFFNVTNYKYNCDYGDRVTFNITKLFKDNEQMSKYILEIKNVRITHIYCNVNVDTRNCRI